MPRPTVRLVACLLCTTSAWVFAADDSAHSEDTLVVRIAVDDVPAVLRSEIDPCAIDPGRRAVFFLSAKRTAELEAAGVPLEVVTSLRDHLREFAPLRTLQHKRIPALDGLDPGSAAAGRQGQGDGGGDDGNAGDVCADIGTSLQPYNVYHNLEEGVCFIHNLAAAYPEITQLMTIGTSVEGRDIWALKISDQPQVVDPDEDRILFTGLTHAREWATHEMVLYMAEYLTSRYDSDLAVKHIVDHSEVWLVPAVNPDGYVYTWTDFRMWRKNRANVDADPHIEGVDLNRNYDFNWGPEFPGSSGEPGSETYRGPAPASEPEVQAIQSLLAGQRFAIAVGFHTYGQYVFFPWGYTRFDFPQSYTALRACAHAYSARVEQTHGRRYTPGQGSYTSYITNGDFDDYAYAEHGALSFTPELRPDSSGGGGFALPEGQIKPNNEENMAAAMWLMTNVASATDVHNPASPTLIENVGNGGNRFSLALPPTNAKPEVALNFPIEHGDTLTTYVGNVDQPAGDVTYPDGFEGCGPGREYLVSVSSELHDWAFGLTSYRALPYAFFDGGEVQLSRQGGPFLQFAAVPGHAPVRMQELKVIKRIVDFNGEEMIEEQRTALQDLNHEDPWLDWLWKWRDAAGVNHFSHPAGDNGASEFLVPFRSYSFQLFESSFDFGSPFQAAYLLNFPGKPYADCNFNARADDQDIAAGLSDDCSGNGIPDECEPDCNDNAAADSCDIAAERSTDANRNDVPDECEPPALLVPTDYPTIQAALDAAAPGTSIVVDDGVYHGPGNRELNFLGKAVLLTSRSGPQACIIDCEGLGRGVFFNQAETADSHLRGFTIRNGKADRGAAVRCATGASPTIRDCVLIDNTASAQGGGLYSAGGCHPSVERCDFRGNQAALGGGAFIASASHPRLQSCLFSGNHAASVGGGVCSPSSASRLQLINATLSANTAGSQGAGVFVAGPGSRLANCILWDNLADGDSSSESAQVHVLTPEAVDISYSLIEGLDTFAFGVANFDADPAFVDALGPDGTAGTADDDLRLMGDSPARDIGDNVAIGVAPTADLDGRSRIIEGVVDLGAYEYIEVPLHIVSSEPPHGAIDARQPSKPDGSDVDGWNGVQLTFSGDVAGLTAGDFELLTTADTRLDIAAVRAESGSVQVTFSDFIPVGACTTLVHSASGTRVSLGYLPADTNADGFSSPVDIVALIDGLNELVALDAWQCDINRSGLCEPSDILRQVDLLNGVGVYGGWTHLPACP